MHLRIILKMCYCLHTLRRHQIGHYLRRRVYLFAAQLRSTHVLEYQPGRVKGLQWAHYRR